MAGHLVAEEAAQLQRPRRDDCPHDGGARWTGQGHTPGRERAASHACARMATEYVGGSAGVHGASCCDGSARSFLGAIAAPRGEDRPSVAIALHG